MKTKRVIEILEMFVGCEKNGHCIVNCEICKYGDYSRDELYEAVSTAASKLKKQVTH